MEKGIINQMWEDFSQLSMKTISEESQQYKDMKSAFISGAWFVLMAMDFEKNNEKRSHYVETMLKETNAEIREMGSNPRPE